MWKGQMFYLYFKLCELNQLKFYGEPVEGGKHRGDVIIPLCPSIELSNSVLNPLQMWEGALAVPNYKQLQ